ncbi:MAG: protein jag [Clostridium sp.]|nr:protein jag [Clostridium sp.]
MDNMEFSGKTVEMSLELALKELNTTEDKITYKILDEGSRGLLGFIGSKPAIIEVSFKRDPEKDAKDFIMGILNNMEIEADIVTELKDNLLKIDLSGPKMGLVIGYRGETLDSIQYLTSLVVNKNNDEYVRVILDIEGYRKKREETLKRLAKKTANKVKKYKRTVKLEPMNPYERRIIHSNLQLNEDVKTFSIGEEPYRRVVIELK